VHSHREVTWLRRNALQWEKPWKPSVWSKDKMSDGSNKNYINFWIKRYKNA